MHANGTQSFAFTVLLVGTAAIIAGIATDYWSYQVFGKEAVSLEIRRGLWRECTTNGASMPAVGEGTVTQCNPRWDVDVEVEQKTVDINRKGIQNWEIAVGVLMVTSVVVAAIALICSPCCCNRCPACLCVIALLAGLCSAIGTGFFAYKTLSQDSSGPYGVLQSELGWSFYLAVGGSVCQLVGAICFGCGCCRRDRQFEYI